jgi:hypothetical protein
MKLGSIMCGKGPEPRYMFLKKHKWLELRLTTTYPRILIWVGNPNQVTFFLHKELDLESDSLFHLCAKLELK